MADPELDPRVRTVDDEQDTPEEARAALLDTLGLPETYYWRAVEQSVLHATRMPAVGGAPPWRSLGPRNIGGRVRSLAFDPTDPNTIYAGTPFGGVWRTRDRGHTWEVLGQPSEALPCSSLAIGASGGAARWLYVGTGEPNGFGGRGLWRVDLATGAFTQLVGPPPDTGTAPDGAANTHHRVQVDPHDPERTFAATDTGLWRREADGSFTNDAAGLAGTVTDVVVDTGIPGDARPGEYRVYLGVENDGVYVYTFDWSSAEATRPRRAKRLSGRIRVALCTYHPEHVFAIGTTDDHIATPVHHSKDRGGSFTEQARPPFHRSGNPCDPPENMQTYHNLVLAVHPRSPNVLIFGAVDMFRSLTFGAAWTSILSWLDHRASPGKHADQHDAVFDPAEPKGLWIGNDGGVAHSRDLGNTWRKRSYGIVAAQFNDVTMHPRFPFILGGGLQDNGTFIGWGGPTWYEVGGGDGGMVAFDPADVRRAVICTQNNVRRLEIGEGWPSDSRMAFLADASRPLELRTTNLDGGLGSGFGSLFIGHVVHHPTAADHMLVGRKNGAFLGTRTPPATEVTLDEITGIDAAGQSVVSACYAPDAPDTHWWLGTSGGRVFRTTNGGTDWDQLALPDIDGAYIAHIAVHPGDRDLVAIAAASRRSGGATPDPGKVYMAANANDAAPGWQDISGRTGPNTGLPPGPITAVAFDPVDPHLYAAAIAGVYRLDYGAAPPPAAPAWEAFIVDLPLVLVSDLAFAPLVPAAPQRRRLRCSTFGRGMFEVELDPTGARPPSRLHIKQHIVEEALTYPRNDTSAEHVALGGDPRLSSFPPTFDLSIHSLLRAFDIRVDAPPLRDEPGEVDGSELDIEVASDFPRPGEPNAVYVQVRDGGAPGGAANAVDVALYLAAAQGGAAPAVHADFWTALDAGDPPPAGDWSQIGRQTIQLAPDSSRVVRFPWTPPALFEGAYLLAACTSGADRLNAGPTAITDLLRAERRVAVRRVDMQVEIQIRRAFADSGDAGAVAFAARSPDIVIAPAGVDPNVEYADLTLAAPGEPTLSAGANRVVVRAHNRSAVPLDIQVELRAAPVDEPWRLADPASQVGATETLVGVPPRSARFSPDLSFTPPDDRAYLLVAAIGRTGVAFPTTAEHELGELFTQLATVLPGRLAARAYRRA